MKEDEEEEEEEEREEEEEERSEEDEKKNWELETGRGAQGCEVGGDQEVMSSNRRIRLVEVSGDM